MDSRVRGHPPRLGIDRGDRLLQEPHAGLRDVAVGQPHRVGRRAPEHHVELREPEDERVALVDQRHLDLVAERLREHGAQLQPAEPRPENEYARAHRATISALARARLQLLRRARTCTRSCCAAAIIGHSLGSAVREAAATRARPGPRRWSIRARSERSESCAPSVGHSRCRFAACERLRRRVGEREALEGAGPAGGVHGARAASTSAG